MHPIFRNLLISAGVGMALAMILVIVVFLKLEGLF